MLVSLWKRNIKADLAFIVVAIALAGMMVIASLIPVQALPFVVQAPNDALMSNLSIPNDAPTKGMWSPTQTWPLVAIHAGVLPDGNVISYGTPLGQGIQDGRVFDVWEPSLGFTPTSHTTSSNAQGVNSFCSSATHLPNGSTLISGGNNPLAGTLFNPLTTLATATTNLNYPHWYGSMIMLADGRAFISGGGEAYAGAGQSDPDGYIQNKLVSMTPEVYSPQTGWQALSSATSRDAFGPDFNRYYYPRAWVAPNGKIFGITSESLWYLDPTGTGSVQAIGKFKEGANETTRPNIGPSSTAVMYDTGKILQVGGNGYGNGYPSTSSTLATTFDITGGAAPVIQETAPMSFGRQWANATVLPTGTVFVNGGTRYADNGDPDAVYEPELWSPLTGKWIIGARANDIRNYHSTSTLLPNGTVITAGGGVPGPVTNLNAAIYYPPYLFIAQNGKAVLATRPKIQSMDSNQMLYNSTFQVQMGSTETISKVALIGLSNGTHGFNSGQRLYTVRFTQTGNLLALKTPANANLAPPGYYQVVAVNTKGVPSYGAIVAVGKDTALPPKVTWNVCAKENEVCSFKGTQTVRYGANGTYSTKTLSNPTLCSNSVFGDPLPGAIKQCEIRSVPIPPPTNDWTFCAVEDGTCSFSGTQSVRYGANGKFNTGVFTSTVTCNNTVFGDPAPGVRKQCETNPTLPASNWTFCAIENDICSFSGTKTVRYGANGVYATQTLSNGTACTNSVFGDPISGVLKQCEFQ